MRLQDMAQTASSWTTIKREATKTRANPHLPNCLSGKDIALKTTQTFLTTSCELYRAILRPIVGVEISGV